MRTTIYTVVQKTEPLHYCNKILKETMKCSTIQRENVNRVHAAIIIATDVQKGIPFHGHKPRDVVSIRQSRHDNGNCLLYARQDALDQTLLQLVFQKFQKLLKWSLSILLLQILSRICLLQIFKLIQIF